MEVMNYQLARSSYQDSLKVLESDIQHANALAAAVPRAKGGARLQMKLVHHHLTPLVLFLLQWIDCACFLPRYLSLSHILVYKVYPDGNSERLTRGRKASIRDFYAVILPSLRRLHDNLGEFNTAEEKRIAMDHLAKKKLDGIGKQTDADQERDDECGICLEPCTKMVVPSCCHSMCIKCYRNWNSKSVSCPFCRGSLKRVNSEDLWVLTCKDDVVDTETISHDELLRFYLYINSLPKDYPDALFFLYYEYLI